jgi:UDP-N-acetylglucosamine 2-epimerase (non-hydrolysing)
MRFTDHAVLARPGSEGTERLRALVVLGTRPEVIKLAPVIWALAEDGRFEPLVCLVGQQGDILRKAVEEWGISPAYTVELPVHDRRLAATLASMLAPLADCIEQARPHVVVVEGDTTTNVAAALAAFYAGVPVAHVEAGLRTHDPLLPFPEEMHRRVVDRLATFHYAPTDGALQNLAGEGISGGSVALVGNTVVDALRAAIAGEPTTIAPAAPATMTPSRPAKPPTRTLVVTAHRRESFGGGITRICKAVARLATERPDLRVVYVLHSNPRARKPAIEHLSALSNVELIEPQPYRAFIRLLGTAHIVLTDSGGIQEEAPYLGVPVLITRPSTERPEVQQEGGAWVIGTAVSRIVSAVGRLLDDEALHAQMGQVRAPFGDGQASERICAHIAAHLAPSLAAPEPIALARAADVAVAATGGHAETAGSDRADEHPGMAAAVPDAMADGRDMSPMALEGAQ